MDDDGLDPWLLSRRLTLDEWVCVRNIQAFEREILHEPSENRRAQLKSLLNEEHRRLRAAGQPGF